MFKSLHKVLHASRARDTAGMLNLNTSLIDRSFRCANYSLRRRIVFRVKDAPGTRRAEEANEMISRNR